MAKHEWLAWRCVGGASGGVSAHCRDAILCLRQFASANQ